MSSTDHTIQHSTTRRAWQPVTWLVWLKLVLWMSTGFNYELRPMGRYIVPCGKNLPTFRKSHCLLFQIKQFKKTEKSGLVSS